MSARFQVKPVGGMCLGSGAFVVADTHAGDESMPFRWKDDADRLARQWNAQHAREEAEVLALVAYPGEGK